MIVVGVDLSTKTGLVAAEMIGGAEGLKVVETEHAKLPKTVAEYGHYPESYLRASEAVAIEVCAFIEEHHPDKIIIEETNLSKGSRYAQKILEFIHRAVLARLNLMGLIGKVEYVSSSEWRKKTEVKLTAADRAQNKLLSRAKSQARRRGARLDKVALGIAGKVTLKHVAVRHVKQRFGLELTIGQNDIADAICLVEGWALGAKICDGKSGKSSEAEED